MNRVLKGEALGAFDLLLPLAMCALIAAAGVAFVARQLRFAALR